MLTLRTGCGDIIVMAARVVHRPAPIVGSCLQDGSADEAGLEVPCDRYKPTGMMHLEGDRPVTALAFLTDWRKRELCHDRQRDNEVSHVTSLDAVPAALKPGLERKSEM